MTLIKDVRTVANASVNVWMALNIAHVNVNTVGLVQHAA